MLSSSAEMLSKDFDKRLRSIEVEWDDMYQKFSRLAGRMDRQKAIQSQTASQEPDNQPPPVLTRGDLLRKWRARQ